MQQCFTYEIVNSQRPVPWWKDCENSRVTIWSFSHWLRRFFGDSDWLFEFSDWLTPNTMTTTYKFPLQLSDN